MTKDLRFTHFTHRFISVSTFVGLMLDAEIAVTKQVSLLPYALTMFGLGFLRSVLFWGPDMALGCSDCRMKELLKGAEKIDAI